MIAELIDFPAAPRKRGRKPAPTASTPPAAEFQPIGYYWRKDIEEFRANAAQLRVCALALLDTVERYQRQLEAAGIEPDKRYLAISEAEAKPHLVARDDEAATA